AGARVGEHDRHADVRDVRGADEPAARLGHRAAPFHEGDRETGATFRHRADVPGGRTRDAGRDGRRAAVGSAGDGGEGTAVPADPEAEHDQRAVSVMVELPYLPVRAGVVRLLLATP